jgi:CHAT domain-containing protein/tetratricopeptide (TPR) repeat protein
MSRASRVCAGAALVLAVGIQPISSAQAPSPRALTNGTSIEAVLNAGETHTYAIDLLPEQYVFISVLQQGIDVLVALEDPGGQPLVEVDGPTGKYGAERARLIATRPGVYRVQVKSLERGAPAGRYRLDVRELRIAGDEERRRVEAQAAYLEAIQLRVQNKAESLRKSLAKYEAASELWKSVGDLEEEGTAENDLGYIHRLLSDYPSALTHYERALDLRRQARDGPGEAQTLTNLGALAYLLGENQRALGYYEAALPLRRAEGNFQEQALLLSNIGEVHAVWGEHQKALEHYREALPAQRRVGDRLRESLTLSNIGLIYRTTGQPTDALRFFDDALAAARESGNRRIEARVLVNRGGAFDDAGEVDKALDSYQQALTLQRAAGDRLGESETLNAIGVLLARRGENQAALDHFTRALDLQRAVGSRRNEAGTLANMASVLAERGTLDEAQKSLEQSLALRRQVQDRRGEAQSLFGLARVHRRRGHFAEALSAGEGALEIVEALRTKVVSQEMRASYFATSLEMYELVVATLMDLDAAKPGSGYAARAFQVSERARARSLLDALSEAQGGVRQGISDELRLRQRDLQDRINVRAERQIQLLSGQNTQADADRISRELDALLTELQELEAEIRARSPRYAELTQPRPLDVTAIQRDVLDDDTLLLQFALGRERSFLWLLTRTSIDSVVLPPRAEIERATQRFYSLLTARNEDRTGETPAVRRQRIASAELELPRAAGELSRMLLAPVADRLQTKRLLVVADGALQYIPFGVLPESRGEPLILTHEIVSSPSASALALLRAEHAGAPRHRKQVAIIADPVFSPGDPRFTPRAKDEVTRSATSAAPGGFRRLRFSREEADAIASLTKPGERLEATDFNASRQTALTEDLSQYRMVHFSTHGVLNNEHPELSGLVLSLYDTNGKPQDGFLRLHDIYNLPLNADLVVLSACETALGRQIRGEGLIGLARGFMYAGASRVVASLWKVEDQATASLMKQFYEAMLARGESPASALRAAQIEMWRTKRWHSPYYWAPFVLQGEWR